MESAPIFFIKSKGIGGERKRTAFGLMGWGLFLLKGCDPFLCVNN
jgi:hypothetical protein